VSDSILQPLVDPLRMSASLVIRWVISGTTPLVNTPPLHLTLRSI